MNRGVLYVVSGPSGCGKGTICKQLMEEKHDVYLSVSATTRAPREGEEEGVSYFFLSEDEFVAKTKQDGFLEWACFCGNYYGTPKKNVEDMLERGMDVILEIEVQGAMKIRAKYPEAVFVFVLPPSQEELESRLSGRGTETPEAIKNRLNRAKSEYNYIEKYNYILMNDTVEQAVGRFKAIMEAERCLVSRNRPFIESLL